MSVFIYFISGSPKKLISIFRSKGIPQSLPSQQKLSSWFSHSHTSHLIVFFIESVFIFKRGFRPCYYLYNEISFLLDKTFSIDFFRDSQTGAISISEPLISDKVILHVDNSDSNLSVDNVL